MSGDALRLHMLQWGRCLRDPDNNAPPEGIERPGLEIYRSLRLGNVGRMMASAFPTSAALLGSDRWQLLVEAFCRDHRCRTPLFARIADEFDGYLQTCRADLPAWLPELVHHEWTELEVLRSDAVQAEHCPGGHLGRGVPVISVWLRLRRYEWPVHLLSVAHPPVSAAAEPVHMMACRDVVGQVRFSILGTMTFQLLEWMQQGQDHTGMQLLERLAAHNGMAFSRGFAADGMTALRALRHAGVVLGTRPDR